MPAKPTNCLNFTKTKLLELQAPAAGYSVFHDTTVEGLVLLIYPTGGSRFYVSKKIEGKSTRIKIGKFPDVSVDNARKKAHEILTAIAKGEAPTRKKEPKDTGINLDGLVNHYSDEYSMHHCSTWKETKANFRRYFADWLERPADSITQNEVQQRINQLGSGK